MAVGFMREAYEARHPTLLRDMEAIREHATVQQELDLRDMNRRYVEPRRAARERSRKREAKRAAHRSPSADILEVANGHLSAAIDGLETLPADGPFDAEAVRRARQAIAEAGGLVSTEFRGGRAAFPPTSTGARMATDQGSLPCRAIVQTVWKPRAEVLFGAPALLLL
jgi:hypothetical protein